MGQVRREEMRATEGGSPAPAPSGLSGTAAPGGRAPAREYLDQRPGGAPAQPPQPPVQMPDFEYHVREMRRVAGIDERTTPGTNDAGYWIKRLTNLDPRWNQGQTAVEAPLREPLPPEKLGNASLGLTVKQASTRSWQTLWLAPQPSDGVEIVSIDPKSDLAGPSVGLKAGDVIEFIAPVTADGVVPESQMKIRDEAHFLGLLESYRQRGIPGVRLQVRGKGNPIVVSFRELGSPDQAQSGVAPANQSTATDLPEDKSKWSAGIQVGQYARFKIEAPWTWGGRTAYAGANVEDVKEGGPSYLAGIRRGDVIRKFRTTDTGADTNGSPKWIDVQSDEHFMKLMEEAKARGFVSFEVQLLDGRNATVNFAALPDGWVDRSNPRD